jgi:MSHA biogenesis protein MshG
MSSFGYTGRSAGQPVQGRIEAMDPVSAAEALMARGITPLRIAPVVASEAGSGAEAGSVRSLAALWAVWRRPRVSLVDLMLFARQISILLRAGVPILRGLGGLIESATNLRFKQVLIQIRQSLESGRDLGHSLAAHPEVFGGFFVAMVKVGETTGRLDDVFLRLFHHMEFEQFMRQQIKSALRYPSFVVVAMVAAVTVINLFVIPAFESVFKGFGAELPWMTRLLLATSRFTIDFGLLIALAVAAAIVVWRQWIQTDAGRYAWDRAKLSLPLAGRIIRKALLSRFARSLALALRSGVPVAQAMGVVAATVENAYMARKVDEIRRHVERGESILRAAALSQVFTPVVLQMIAIGEETGAVDELMDEVANLYAGDVEYDIKTLGQQIEPILIVFLGILVLILALGVFLPVWDLGRAAFHR